MRILVLTNLYPNPYQRNLAPFNRQQFRALADRHELAVIAPIAWTTEAAARRKGPSPWGGGRRAVHDGVPVEYPRFLYPPGVLREWHGAFYRESVRPAFERAVAGFRPDLLLASWAYPDGWAGVELGRRAGLPVVIKVHGCDVLGLHRRPGRPRRTIDALRRADGIVTVSRDLADRVVEFGVDPARVRVVYNGIDTALFHPGPRAPARARLGLEGDDPLLLYVGSLEPIKGPDLLVEACGLLAAGGARFTCALIGQGPWEAKLRERVARLGLEGRVRLTGPRPLDQLPDWYRAASVFVLPSRSEGVPNVLLEATACGTPYVATRVGGVPEVAHLGEGRLVPPADPSALAEGIAGVLAAPPARPAGGHAPRGYAGSAADLADFLEENLRKGGRPSPSPGVPGCR